MDSRIETIASEYRDGKINRRVFLERLIALVGSYKLAHHFLEQSGMAMSLLSPTESDSANVDSTAVKMPGDGVTIEGYLSKPKGKGPFPGIILIHENRGLNEHIRDVARRLAGQGYATLAPDMLSRQGGTASFATPDDAVKAFQSVKDDDVIRDRHHEVHVMFHHQDGHTVRSDAKQQLAEFRGLLGIQTGRRLV